MNIQNVEIKRIINDEKEYRYARFLNIEDLLERMTISLDENNQCYRINARMNDHDQKYIISMKMNIQGEIIQYHCSCHYQTSTYGCRHLGALLIYLQKQNIDHFPYFYEKGKEEQILKYQLLEQQRQERMMKKKYQDAYQLIDLYKDRLTREAMIPLATQKYQLKVIVRKYQEHLKISFKIIHQQSYVIKNIKQFLHAVKHHENLKYGKYFEFVHSYDAFDEDSLEILHFMEKLFIQQQYSQKGVLKDMDIDSYHLDDFFNLMSNLPSSYCDIAFQDKETMIPLEIEDKGDYFLLDLNDYQIFEGAMLSFHYLYILSQDILYRYGFDEKGQCLILLQKLLENQGGIYIEKSSLQEFYQYVLLDVLDYIQLNTSLFNDYEQEDMINLYADITSQDQICIQIEYIYQDHLSYAFEDNQYISKEAHLIESYIQPYIEDQDDHLIYLKYDHDFTYSFILEGLPYLSHYCQVFVSDALKGFSTPREMNIKVGIQMSSHLLEINIDSIHVHKDELFDVLKAYKKNRKFYKLKNGELLSLKNNELKELSELTSALQIEGQDLQQDKITIPMYRLFHVNQISHLQSHIQYQKNEMFQNITEHFEQSKHFDIPQRYQSILREYQQEGYQWLRLMEYYGFSGILADDMGLGKTLQIIVYFESMKDIQQPSLVITPASLLLNWQDEIAKFSSDLDVLCIYGHKDERLQLIHSIQHQIVITSYDYMRKDVDLYEKINFHTIVLDEAQYIKNPKTLSALSVKRLSSQQRFALTGTPIENSLAEIWSIFDFLMPQYLYHYTYFLEHFERPIVKDSNEEKQQQLKQMIAPFILRRNKRDVLKELPDKIEKTMYFQFDEEEERIYLSHLVQINKKLQDKLDLHQLGKIDVLAMLTRLRQICQDARLIDEQRQDISSKLKGCMDLIHSLNNNHQKILLFSSFTSVLHLIQEQCQKEHIACYLLEGSMSKTKRKQMVDQFQIDDTPLFLISLKAGGSGLNLTAAQAVIHFDPWWNMSAKNQATDRAYRIGQTQIVQVFSLIMKNSIEEKIMELQKQKKNLADTFVEGQQQSLSRLTMDDLKELLRVEEKL